MCDTTINLLDILRPEFVYPDIRSGKRNAVIRELAELLAGQCEGLDADRISGVLLAREEQGSTAIGDGVAIPHAKLDSLDTMTACLARSVKGVAFDAQDGKPVHLFLVILSPVDSAGSHLKMLARFGQLARKPEFRTELMRAGSADEIHALIAAQDSK